MRLLKKLTYYVSSIIRMVYGFKNFLSLIPLFLNRGLVEQTEVVLRKSGLRLVARGAMDIWAIKETFLDAFYIRYGVPIKDGWTVVDIGAGIGDFSIYAAHANPQTKVFAFEPFPESYHLLERNIALNSIENVFPFEAAIWSQAGVLHLDNLSGEPLQIISKEMHSTKKGNNVIKVRALTLSQVFEAHAIDKLDLLKLDCEGAEYEILSGASPEVFKKIERIIMEYHDIDGHHHDQLVSLLERQGFRVYCHDNFVHDDIGYLYAEHG
ncbi:MAG: Methyltransferase FkbM family [Anaerolinea thermophila]|uniref:Methyltransferase FkbM family n=1 Tax=Anaerolinea thermophila TaxID=167964 RepID=A0A101FXL9_9CHLR|nr:MAG: Methyltransferase FkbM family [Anaerolinea thermophila]